MERSRPTMKDVAAAARVSLKTVSRVVNGEPSVTPDTEQRVRDAITTLGFRRDDSARLLRTGQAATVGLVLEDIGDPFCSALSRGVESVARASRDGDGNTRAKESGIRGALPRPGPLRTGRAVGRPASEVP